MKRTSPLLGKTETYSDLFLHNQGFFIVKALGQVFSSKKRLCSELYKFYEIFLIKTYTRSRHILSGCYSKYQIVGLKNSHFFYYISQILATIRDVTPWEHSHKIISMFWGNTEHIELMMLSEDNIKVAQYLTELPEKKWFADKLTRSIEIAKSYKESEGK